MQSDAKRQMGVFDPEDLKKISDELEAGDVVGETPEDRDNRAAALLHRSEMDAKTESKSE